MQPPPPHCRMDSGSSVLLSTFGGLSSLTVPPRVGGASLLTCAAPRGVWGLACSELSEPLLSQVNILSEAHSKKHSSSCVFRLCQCPQLSDGGAGSIFSGLLIAQWSAEVLSARWSVKVFSARWSAEVPGGLQRCSAQVLLFTCGHGGMLSATG